MRTSTNSSWQLFGLGLAIAWGMGGTTSLAEPGDLTGLIEQAKAEFQPVSEEELADTRDHLIREATAFERWLRPGTPYGDGWMEYLEWGAVQKALASDDRPDVAPLRNTLGRFRAGAKGTERHAFRRVADALEQYIDRVEITRARDQQGVMSQQFDLLKQYVERYERDRSARARFEIERRLDLLSGIGRGDALSRAITDRFRQPNIRMSLSSQFLDKAVFDRIDDVGPVRDCILGTSIYGTGHTIGHASLRTLRADDRAAVEIVITGTTHSQTTGYNSPVVIRSSAQTHFTGRKRVDFLDDNFWNYPAVVHATTRSQTHSVQKQGGGFGSRLVERIGSRRVAESKPQADAIAANHAEARIRREMDDEILPKLQNARFDYLDQFKRPFSQRNADPESVRFSSTERSVEMAMLQRGRGLLGADSPPPAPGDHDLTLRLHETGIANVAAALLGGATLSQRSRSDDPSLNVTLPEWLDDAMKRAREENEEEEVVSDEDFKPWALRFRRGRPVTVELTGNTVKLTLHATEIETGENVYRNWDISATYALEPQEGSLLLARQGDIEVIPTRFDPTEGGRLTSREVGERSNLAKELNRQADDGRGLAREFKIDPIALKDDLEHLGPLMLRTATSDEGWLLLGWMLP